MGERQLRFRLETFSREGISFICKNVEKINRLHSFLPDFSYKEKSVPPTMGEG